VIVLTKLGREAKLTIPKRHVTQKERAMNQDTQEPKREEPTDPPKSVPDATGDSTDAPVEEPTDDESASAR
jgi:hypothetical protein